MMRVVDCITQLVGKTPLVELKRWYKGPHTIYAKLEYMNPGGSVKDSIPGTTLRGNKCQISAE